jgi:hypothetical protein
VMVRRLIAWQDLKNLPEAVMWQLDARLLNSPHSGC